MTRAILVMGSANIDLVATAPRYPMLGETLLGNSFASFNGGKGANQAVAAARAGGQVSFLGCVGRDDLGSRLRAGLVQAGVNCGLLSEVEGASGTALIISTASGENAIVVVPGANSALTAEMVDRVDFRPFGLVLAQLETPIDGVQRAAERARAVGAVFILDPAPARRLPAKLLAMTDWLTPNEHEARTLLGRSADGVDDLALAAALGQLGGCGIVLKLGAAGAILMAPDESPVFVPPLRVNAVDSTGAGDAFNAAFGASLAEGRSPAQAAAFASAAAAVSVTLAGAQPSMPHRAAIDNAVRRGRVIVCSDARTFRV